jgi:DNA polymerase elongation subunit (family B)
MANVCSVPFSFIFLRGQGIKLQSLVFKECRQNKQLIETLPRSGAAQTPQKKDEDDDEDDDDDDEEGYEGAIVLEPKTGLYLEDPVSVLDYNSLYPSSMISENISHDTIVSIRDYDNEGNLVSMRGAETLENLEDYDYVDIDFDILKTDPEDKRKHPAKISAGKRVCRYVQFKDGKKGTIPTILMKLLQARKDTRKKQAAYPEKSFMWMLLEALQLAFKVTANSLYGQIGASTSKIRFIELAASTTAFGRKLITYAKTSVEEYFGNTPFSSAEYVYGDTDSVFIKFRPRKPDGTYYVGEEALPKCIELGQMASKILSGALRAPHNLEYEKTFYPFCLLSKKRYVGHKYTTDTKKFDFTSMGIALKRRDYSTVVKEVYRGAVDILMNEKNVDAAVKFTRDYLDNLINGRIDIRKLMLTKSLRAEYANPMKIAHKVLGIHPPNYKGIASKHPLSLEKMVSNPIIDSTSQTRL